jgi:hypothetical protein
MTVEAFVGSLSPAEKLRVMELIWRELSASDVELPTPNWHDDIVHQRLDHPSQGEALALGEALEEIQGWRNAGKTPS